MNRLTSKTERLAARYIPSFAACRTLTDAAAVYTYERGGQFGVIAFRGTAARAEFHYTYRTAESRDTKISEFLDGIAQRAEYMKTRKRTAITRTTFKTFLKKNANALLVKRSSQFDGMTDCVETIHDASFCPSDADAAMSGLIGRDSFSAFEDNQLVGIRVYNCCGSFTVATQKEAR